MSNRKKNFINRVGEIHYTNQNYKSTIIQYFNSKNCTIQFEDGTILYNIFYANLIKGKVLKPVDRKGEESKNYQGYTMVIIEWKGHRNSRVQFKDEKNTVIENVYYNSFLKGTVKNPNHPSVCGIGYQGQGKYVTKINGKHTVFYERWSGVLTRSKTESYKNKFPTYHGVTVCEEWECFQNFAEWFDEKWRPEYMDNTWHLDKDILIKGNKIYSPETCCLIPNEINALFTKSTKGKYPTGISKKGNRFVAYFAEKYQGSGDTPEEAFMYYKTAKEKKIKNLANKWRPYIEHNTYIKIYNYQVEITD